MIIVKRDLWLCVDCTMLAVNGDDSGMDDATAARCSAGLDALGPHVAADWEADEDTGEITDGHYNFSRIGCDCCGSRLAGEMHRFAILGSPDATIVASRIPADYPVRPILTADDRVRAADPVECGTCGLAWDDSIATGMTPAPAGRCPFEAFHDSEEQ